MTTCRSFAPWPVSFPFRFRGEDGHPCEALCVVHGGAWDIPEPLSAGHRAGVKAAFEAVRAALEEAGSPLDALVAGLGALEDDPVFDAGHGSFLNEEGRVELDAGVMEGAALRAGAVAGLSAFAYPAAIALDVLRETSHVLLVGEGAGRFARARGHAPVADTALVHPREVEAHARWIAAGRPDARTFFGDPGSGSLAGGAPEKRGTVGVVLAVRAVAPETQGAFEAREAGRDAECDGERRNKGNNTAACGWSLFAGASTGGTPGKMVGRVGDVPVPGAGFYADDRGAAVSATGWGEAFLRMLPCKRVSDLCALGASAQEACERALQETLARTGGRGGLIAISHRGEVGAAFSTPDMALLGPHPPARL